MKTTSTNVESRRRPRAARQRSGEPGRSSIESVHRRVWAPIALRAAALGIALVGLAGIGAAVGHAPLVPVQAVAKAGFGLDALSTRALALARSGGSSGLPAASPSAPSADPRPASNADPAQVSDAHPAPRARADSAPTPPAAPCSCPCAASRHGEGGPNASAPSLTGAVRNELRVFLNRASAVDLRRLPGVGAKRAEAILALRQRLGRFRKPSDLLRVKGIGPRTLERMSPYLVLD
jgi:competence protein ComEA